MRQNTDKKSDRIKDKKRLSLSHGSRKSLTATLLATAAFGILDSAEAAKIGDRLWRDLNGNGIRDSGEPGLGNRTVKLYKDTNGDGVPEKIVQSKLTSGAGGYSFNVNELGRYAIGVDMINMPDNIYRVTSQDSGNNNSNDSDLNPNSLRTKVINVNNINGDYHDEGDIGFLVGSSDLTFLGLAPWGNNGEITVQRWLYQDMLFVVDDNGESTSNSTRSRVLNWMKGYSKADKIQQTVQQSSSWLADTRTSTTDSNVARRGRKRLLYTTVNGAFGTGDQASATLPRNFWNEDPNNFSFHQILLYEMNRGGNQGDNWHARAVWPTNASFGPSFGVSDLVINTPHVLTAVTMFELGGFTAISGNTAPWNPFREMGLGATGNLAQYAASSQTLPQLFPGWEKTKSAPIPNPLGSGNSIFRSPVRMIMFQIYREQGIDALAEVLLNISQKDYPGSIEQSIWNFTSAVTDATGNTYRSKLQNDWKMTPTAQYQSNRGVNSGSFQSKDSYQWDFAPHGIPSNQLLPGYELFSERTTQGFFKFERSSTSDPAAFFYNEQKSGSNDNQSFVQYKGGGKLSHRIDNGKWKIELDLRVYSPGEFRVEGVPDNQLDGYTQGNTSRPSRRIVSFEQQVNDGMLDIEITGGGPTIFGMRVTRVGGSGPGPGSTASGVVREYWTGVSGKAVSDIPATTPPTGTDTLSSLEAHDWNDPNRTKDWGNNYGQIITGYLQAPQTGNYTFWISSDDQSQFFLSSDSSVQNSALRASVPQWTNQKQWNKFSQQKSAPIFLTAGENYFLQIMHKENSGGDHVAVGWSKPGQSTSNPSEVVPNSVLNTNLASLPGVVREYWTGITGKQVSQVPITTTPTGTDRLDRLEATNWNNSSQTQNWGNNYGQLITGYLKAPTSGSYTFWIASDDTSEFYLSTNGAAANSVLRASVPGWTNKGQWNKFPQQKSATVNLQAGQVYFLQIIHKENTGGDHVAVGWAKPGQSTNAPSEIVPMSVLTTEAGGQ